MASDLRCSGIAAVRLNTFEAYGMVTSSTTLGEMLAESVFSLATETTGADAEEAKRWEVEPSRYIREKLYLHLWCVDLAVTRAVGHESAHRPRILDAFYKRTGDIAAGIGWSSLMSDLAIRNASYAEAFNRPHEMGIPYTVGKAFALACNSEWDAAVIMIGAKLFAGYETAIGDLVRTWRRDHS